MTIQDAAKYAVERAMKSGAEQADVYLEKGRESTVTVRMGEVETLKQATSKGLGLRVFIGNKLGFAYTSDFSKKSLKDFAARTVEMAQEITSDPHNVLPQTARRADYPDLDLYDPQIAEIPIDWKIKTAKQMEDTAFAYDGRIKNSSGSSVFDSELEAVITNSEGVFHTYKTSSITLVCQLVAEADDKKQSNYWYESKRFFGDIGSADEISLKAAHRALRMLGATKPKTQVVPVVFDPQMAASFVAIFFGALNGERILKKSSFLVDKLGEKIATDNFTLVDDALLKRGVGSQPVDDEGVPTSTHLVIDKGELKMYFYDAYSAHKAGTVPTGNARRGYTSTPSVGAWNLYLQKGETDPKDIIASVDNGLYLTRTMGYGVNMVNGDISRGAAGLWIENGQLAYPVEEATIAGNLLTMLQNVSMIGNDLEFNDSRSAPTIKIEDVTVSGT